MSMYPSQPAPMLLIYERCLTLQEDISLAAAAKKRLERLERVMATQAKSRAACAHKVAPPLGGEGAVARIEARSQQQQQQQQQAGPMVTVRGPLIIVAPAAACVMPFGDGAAAAEDAEEISDEHNSEVQHAVPERLVPGSRDGAMYSGAFGRDRDLRHKMLQEQQGLIRSNPIAFQEDMASQADAKYRCLIAVMGGGVYISLAFGGIYTSLDQSRDQSLYFCCSP